MTIVRSKCCNAGVIIEPSGETSCIKCGKTCGVSIIPTPLPENEDELINAR